MEPLMKLVHELSKWKTDMYIADDDGELPVNKFFDVMFDDDEDTDDEDTEDEESTVDWNEFNEKTLLNLLPINLLHNDPRFLWQTFIGSVINLRNVRDFDSSTECMRDVLFTFTYHMNLTAWHSITVNDYDDNFRLSELEPKDNKDR